MKQPRQVTPLKLAIVASGYTMREIATRADVRENDLSRYARGMFQPRAAAAARIAGALGTTVESLWPSEQTERAA